MRRCRNRRRGVALVAAAAVLLALVGVLILGGGFDDEQVELVAPTDTSPPTERPTSLRGNPYLLSDAEGWDLQDAVDVAPGSVATETDPTLDWYVEYERFPDPDTSQLVRVSSHDAVPSDVVEPYPVDDLDTLDINGAQAIGGQLAERGPAVILVTGADQDHTVMLLSDELSVDELVTWAAPLRPATEAEWVEAGGEVQDG